MHKKNTPDLPENMVKDSYYEPEAYRDCEFAAWTALPESYQEYFGKLTAQATEPLLDAVGTVQGTRLLDVACGPGHLTAAATARGAIAVGVDFVAGMVAEARERHPEIDYREGDAEALPFADESFDAVVCSFGVHHFAHRDKAIAEALRVLVPGGRYAYTVWFPPEEETVSLRWVVRSAIQKYGETQGLLPSSLPECSNLEESRQALLAVGFIDAEAMKLPILGRWSKPEQILETLYKGMGQTKMLMEAQTEEARNTIENAIIENAQSFENDGVIEIPMPAMLAYGRKA